MSDQPPVSDTSGLTASAPSPGGFRFAPGHVLAGRYQVQRGLGRGGMGEVYAAQDTQLNEVIALKTLDERLASAEAIARFQAEVKNARRVSHPGVCRTFEFGLATDANGAPVHFLTMELLTGETLETRLRRGPLGREELTEILGQVARAVDAAHQAGVVHRDLKPANVMLVPHSGSAVRAVVTDFGIARHLADATVTRDGWVGTPAYVSPEQLEGKKVGPAADLYSLGVMLYEAATGRLPFEGGSSVEVAMQRLTRPAPRARDLAPALSLEWDELIARCLARDPLDRVPSAAHVADVLQAGRPLGARRRSRRPFALLFLVAALGLAAGGWWWAGQLPATVVLRCETTHAFPADEAWMAKGAQRLLERRLSVDRRFRFSATDEVPNTVLRLQVTREADGRATVELRAARQGPGRDAFAAKVTAASVAAAYDELAPGLAEVLGHGAPQPPWTDAERAEARRFGAASPESLALYRRFTDCVIQAWEFEIRPCQSLSEELVALDPGWPRAWLTRRQLSDWKPTDIDAALSQTRDSHDELGSRLLQLAAAKEASVPLDWLDGSDPFASYMANTLGAHEQLGDRDVFLLRSWRRAPHLQQGADLLMDWLDDARREALLREWEQLAPEALMRLISVRSVRALAAGRFLHGNVAPLALASVRLAIAERRFGDARVEVGALQSSPDPQVLTYALWLGAQAAVYDGRFGEALRLADQARAASERLPGRDPDFTRVVLFELSLRVAEALDDQVAARALRAGFRQLLGSMSYTWAARALLDYQASPAACPALEPFRASLAGRPDEAPGLALLERAANDRGCSTCQAVLKRGLQGSEEYFDSALLSFIRCARQVGELDLATKGLAFVTKVGAGGRFADSPYDVVLAQFEKARVLEALGRRDEARAAWADSLQFWREADRPVPELKEAREALTRLGGVAR